MLAHLQSALAVAERPVMNAICNTETSSNPSTRRYFVSTAIPYVNAEPHLGHAWESVLADVIVRSSRRRGAEVWFTSGTDDNSQKNVRAATSAGIDVEQWVEQQSENFAELQRELGVVPTTFVRTSNNAEHVATVHALWKRCAAAGDLYAGHYRGYYCVGCEQYFRNSEVPEGGTCPEHGVKLEELEERNIFFRISKYAPNLQSLIEADVLRVTPQPAKAEVLAFLAAGVQDISISRARKRGETWGIPVPGCDEQVVWVWFDALCNYLTSVGFSADTSGFSHYWEGAATRVHVIGKGINRFHTVVWPALLLSAGVALPTDVLVHGHLTVGGQKISKSSLNGVAPRRLVEHYGSDAVRYYLCRHANLHRDTDFSVERFHAVYETELVHGFGNTVNRVVSLARRYLTPDLLVTDVDPDVETILSSVASHVERAEREWSFGRAIEAIFDGFTFVNGYLERHAPWKSGAMAGDSAEGQPEAIRSAQRVLGSARYLVIVLVELLEPYLPNTVAVARESLTRNEPKHLFAKVPRWE